MADPDVAVITPGPLAGPSHSDLCNRLAIGRSEMAAAYERAKELLYAAECALAQNRALRRTIKETVRDRRSLAARKELLERSGHAQMVVRLETMPVIEQAKGIIMIQARCGEAEAFDLLRRASQLSNVPVQELAAQLVAKSAGQTTV